MIYAWGIDSSSDRDGKRIACGVVVAKHGDEAEKIVRADWKIDTGYFSASRIWEGKPESKQSVLLYKNTGVL